MSTINREPITMSSGHGFIEGVRWHDGDAYASDFFKKKVYRWAGGQAGEGEVVCEVEGQPSGLGWTLDGDLLVVSMIDRRLLRLDGDELVEVAKLGDRATWHSNDLVVDAEGRAYVGNFGWDESTDPVIKSTVLQRVDPDGSVTVVAEDMVCPNGMAISPDGGTLFVNETFSAQVTAFDIAADGSLSNRRAWAKFSDETFETVPDAIGAGVLLPDGLALDAEGAIWLADCHGSGATRVAEGGEVLDFVSTAPHATFSVGLSREPEPTLFMGTTFPYGAGDPRVQHESQMRRCAVAVPGAGYPV
jgi:sugar lactone lactonase YvrE